MKIREKKMLKNYQQENKDFKILRSITVAEDGDANNPPDVYYVGVIIKQTTNTLL